MPRRALLALALAGCGGKPGPRRDIVGAPVVLDRRDSQPELIGDVMDLSGRSLLAVHADQPVAQLLAQEFTRGLVKRNYLARTNDTLRLDLTVVMHRLQVVSVTRSQAIVDLDVMLTERPTGREVFRNGVREDDVAPASAAADPTEDMIVLAIRVMDAATDRALDDPRFVAALDALPYAPAA